MKVIVDTNILLLAHNQKIDIFSEIPLLAPQPHDIVILSGVILELENLSSNSKDGIAAKVGLELITRKNPTIMPSTGLVDDYIVELSKTEEIIVATNDAELKKRLKNTKTKIISSKGRDQLQIN